MKVLLVDDHPLILSALQTVIKDLGDDVSVLGAGSAAEARVVLQEGADFDLVLLDLSLGDADGFDVLTELRATYPSLPVVVVSASDRTSDVIRAIDLGAMGFVPKRSSQRPAVRGAAHGHVRRVVRAADRCSAWTCRHGLRATPSRRDRWWGGCGKPGRPTSARRCRSNRWA